MTWFTPPFTQFTVICVIWVTSTFISQLSFISIRTICPNGWIHLSTTELYAVYGLYYIRPLSVTAIRRLIHLFSTVSATKWFCQQALSRCEDGKWKCKFSRTCWGWLVTRSCCSPRITGVCGEGVFCLRGPVHQKTKQDKCQPWSAYISENEQKLFGLNGCLTENETNTICCQPLFC